MPMGPQEEAGSWYTDSTPWNQTSAAPAQLDRTSISPPHFGGSSSSSPSVAHQQAWHASGVPSQSWHQWQHNQQSPHPAANGEQWHGYAADVPSPNGEQWQDLAKGVPSPDREHWQGYAKGLPSPNGEQWQGYAAGVPSQGAPQGHASGSPWPSGEHWQGYAAGVPSSENAQQQQWGSGVLSPLGQEWQRYAASDGSPSPSPAGHVPLSLPSGALSPTGNQWMHHASTVPPVRHQMPDTDAPANTGYALGVLPALEHCSSSARRAVPQEQGGVGPPHMDPQAQYHQGQGLEGPAQGTPLSPQSKWGPTQGTPLGPPGLNVCQGVPGPHVSWGVQHGEGAAGGRQGGGAVPAHGAPSSFRRAESAVTAADSVGQRAARAVIRCASVPERHLMELGYGQGQDMAERGGGGGGMGQAQGWGALKEPGHGQGQVMVERGGGGMGQAQGWKGLKEPGHGQGQAWAEQGWGPEHGPLRISAEEDEWCQPGPVDLGHGEAQEGGRGGVMGQFSGRDQRLAVEEFSHEQRLGYEEQESNEAQRRAAQSTGRAASLPRRAPGAGPPDSGTPKATGAPQQRTRSPEGRLALAQGGYAQGSQGGPIPPSLSADWGGQEGVVLSEGDGNPWVPEERMGAVAWSAPVLVAPSVDPQRSGAPTGGRVRRSPRPSREVNEYGVSALRQAAGAPGASERGRSSGTPPSSCMQVGGASHPPPLQRRKSDPRAEGRRKEENGVPQGRGSGEGEGEVCDVSKGDREAWGSGPQVRQELAPQVEVGRGSSKRHASNASNSEQGSPLDAAASDGRRSLPRNGSGAAELSRKGSGARQLARKGSGARELSRKGSGGGQLARKGSLSAQASALGSLRMMSSVLQGRKPPPVGLFACGMMGAHQRMLSDVPELAEEDLEKPQQPEEASRLAHNKGHRTNDPVAQSAEAVPREGRPGQLSGGSFRQREPPTGSLRRLAKDVAGEETHRERHPPEGHGPRLEPSGPPPDDAGMAVVGPAARRPLQDATAGGNGRESGRRDAPGMPACAEENAEQNRHLRADLEDREGTEMEGHRDEGADETEATDGDEGRRAEDALAEGFSSDSSHGEGSVGSYSDEEEEEEQRQAAGVYGGSFRGKEAQGAVGREERGRQDSRGALSLVLPGTPPSDDHTDDASRSTSQDDGPLLGRVHPLSADSRGAPPAWDASVKESPGGAVSVGPTRTRSDGGALSERAGGMAAGAGVCQPGRQGMPAVQARSSSARARRSRGDDPAGPPSLEHGPASVAATRQGQRQREAQGLEKRAHADTGAQGPHSYAVMPLEVASSRQPTATSAPPAPTKSAPSGQLQGASEPLRCTEGVSEEQQQTPRVASSRSARRRAEEEGQEGGPSGYAREPPQAACASEQGSHLDVTASDEKGVLLEGSGGVLPVHQGEAVLRSRVPQVGSMAAESMTAQPMASQPMAAQSLPPMGAPATRQPLQGQAVTPALQGTRTPRGDAPGPPQHSLSGRGSLAMAVPVADLAGMQEAAAPTRASGSGSSSSSSSARVGPTAADAASRVDRVVGAARGAGGGSAQVGPTASDGASRLDRVRGAAKGANGPLTSYLARKAQEVTRGSISSGPLLPLVKGGSGPLLPLIKGGSGPLLPALGRLGSPAKRNEGGIAARRRAALGLQLPTSGGGGGGVSPENPFPAHGPISLERGRLRPSGLRRGALGVPGSSGARGHARKVTWADLLSPQQKVHIQFTEVHHPPAPEGASDAQGWQADNEGLPSAAAEGVSEVRIQFTQMQHPLAAEGVPGGPIRSAETEHPAGPEGTGWQVGASPSEIGAEDVAGPKVQTERVCSFKVYLEEQGHRMPMAHPGTHDHPSTHDRRGPQEQPRSDSEHFQFHSHPGTSSQHGTPQGQEGAPNSLFQLPAAHGDASAAWGPGSWAPRTGASANSSRDAARGAAGQGQGQGQKGGSRLPVVERRRSPVPKEQYLRQRFVWGEVAAEDPAPEHPPWLPGAESRNRGSFPEGCRDPRGGSGSGALQGEEDGVLEAESVPPGTGETDSVEEGRGGGEIRTGASCSGDKEGGALAASAGRATRLMQAARSAAQAMHAHSSTRTPMPMPRPLGVRALLGDGEAAASHVATPRQWAPSSSPHGHMPQAARGVPSGVPSGYSGPAPFGSSPEPPEEQPWVSDPAEYLVGVEGPRSAVSAPPEHHRWLGQEEHYAAARMARSAHSTPDGMATRLAQDALRSASRHSSLPKGFVPSSPQGLVHHWHATGDTALLPSAGEGAENPYRTPVAFQHSHGHPPERHDQVELEWAHAKDHPHAEHPLDALHDHPGAAQGDPKGMSTWRQNESTWGMPTQGSDLANSDTRVSPPPAYGNFGDLYPAPLQGGSGGAPVFVSRVQTVPARTHSEAAQEDAVLERRRTVGGDPVGPGPPTGAARLASGKMPVRTKSQGTALPHSSQQPQLLPRPSGVHYRAPLPAPQTSEWYARPEEFSHGTGSSRVKHHASGMHLLAGSVPI